MHLAGNTANPFGSAVTPVTVAQLPRLNTLGISMVRIDIAPWGIFPPHTHPWATEIITVLEGKKGDVYVFPVGLVPFQHNVGKVNVVAIVTLSSQIPGVISIANTIFGLKPDISSDILAKAFQVDKSIGDQAQAKF